METQRMSGVINIEEVKIQCKLHKCTTFGSGATNFARKNGFESFSTETQRRTEYEEK
jgi:L-asparaginase